MMMSEIAAQPDSQLGPVRRARKSRAHTNKTQPHPYARDTATPSVSKSTKSSRAIKDTNAPSRIDLRRNLRWHRRYRYHVFDKRHGDMQMEKRAHCTNPQCLYVMSEREVAGNICSDINSFAITCTKCATKFSGWITVTMANFPLYHLTSGLCPAQPAVKRKVREHAPWMWEHHIIHFFKRWYIRFYAHQPTVDLLSATWPSLFWNVLSFYPEDAMLAWHTILGKTLPDINAYMRAHPQLPRLLSPEERFVQVNDKSKNYDETQVEEYEPVSHDRAMFLCERTDDITGSASRFDNVKLNLPGEADSLEYDTLICYELPEYPWGDAKAVSAMKNQKLGAAHHIEGQAMMPPPPVLSHLQQQPLPPPPDDFNHSLLHNPLSANEEIGTSFGLLNPSPFGHSSNFTSLAFLPHAPRV